MIQIPWGILNQQNLYLIPSTAIALLLQYSGSRIIQNDGFSSYKGLILRFYTGDLSLDVGIS